MSNVGFGILTMAYRAGFNNLKILNFEVKTYVHKSILFYYINLVTIQGDTENFDILN